MTSFQKRLSFLTHGLSLERKGDVPTLPDGDYTRNPGNSALADAVLLLTVMPSSEGQVHPQKYVVRSGNSV